MRQRKQRSAVEKIDVIVVGGGNAGLCAALSAAEHGARVVLLERAPAAKRGGNAFVSPGVFRFPYRGLDDLSAIVSDPALKSPQRIDVGAYPETALLDDLHRLAQADLDPELTQALASRAFATMQWLRNQGVDFVLAYDRQAFVINGRQHFWGGVVVKTRGEGPGLVGALYRAAQRTRIAVQYGARATGIEWDAAARWWHVQAMVDDRRRDYHGGAVVLACGGFEANPEMRGAHLGPRWKSVKVRGTPYNTGDGIRLGLAAGGRPFGDWSGCHAVAWDLNAPDANDARVAQHYERDSYPLGIYVNIRGERFLDEGADFRSYTHARCGQEIMRQPQQTAFQIFDQKALPLLRRPYLLPDTTRIDAASWSELAKKAGIESRSLERTVAEYNAAVNAAPFNPAIRDGKAARGITPAKSNWAQRLDAPPYVCFPVTCGLTFTFGGLKISAEAQVLDAHDQPVPGLYACGELVGGLFYHNYPGGASLTAGAVFGRTAGAAAAAHAGRSR